MWNWMGKMCCDINLNAQILLCRKCIFFLKSPPSLYLPGYCEIQAQQSLELSPPLSSHHAIPIKAPKTSLDVCPPWVPRRHSLSLQVWCLGTPLALLGHRLSKKQNILTLVKMVRQTLFGTIAISIGTTAMGFCSREERLGSSPNVSRKSEDL